MADPKLFTPLKAGDIEMKNRVVMAPLTRNRARHADDAPHALNAEYYAQRAGAGLIISEATQISAEGKGYAFTPGVYSDAQIAGWRDVTDAVHAKGGKIVAQIWHVGRISHTSLQPDGQPPVAPSAGRAEGVKTFDGQDFVDVSEPRALGTDEIARVIDDYRHAAEAAKKAGFDGVEVHAANGYLLDQFLRETSNHRDDAYGGSVENRARLVFEVLDAVTEVWGGGGRVGIRISPFSPANGQELGDAQATFEYLVKGLKPYGLSFLHVIEGATGGPRDLPEGASLEPLRAAFDGVWIGNNGYDRDLAVERVENGAVDAVAFGRAYIANPDLAERLERDAPLNEPDPSTFYGGGAEGYTDYPRLEDSQAA
ncbi:alkene reductase [Tranquillimonas alkanivorans]|uniref:N-ethylmaleimide reductase n=1 Tax=Tranquillimonas alkanivorans TaxID=441119 RepID=A0A1I5MP60_9RHOB|nr:alkene reductase [Tranquillimonas alkanivorans]SFP10721.1 N-ethylmaleimide reductase [Tranquillimonas alkanivorans]